MRSRYSSIPMNSRCAVRVHEPSPPLSAEVDELHQRRRSAPTASGAPRTRLRAWRIGYGSPNPVMALAGPFAWLPGRKPETTLRVVVSWFPPRSELWCQETNMVSFERYQSLRFGTAPFPLISSPEIGSRSADFLLHPPKPWTPTAQVSFVTESLQPFVPKLP
jgi:hypothetical protein